MMAACAGLGLFTSNVWAITQTLAGPEIGLGIRKIVTSFLQAN